MSHSCCNRQSPIYVYYPYYGWPGFNPYYMYQCCPACSMPYYQCSCKTETPLLIPEELAVDAASSPKDTFTGGSEDANLTLEYMSDGGTPATRNVKVTIAGPGGTTTVVEETNIADGYHINDNFTSVAPGSKITLEVTDCRARLRWCESICC